MTHNTDADQPEALRLADALRDGQYSLYQERSATEAELRRLHARVQELDAAQALANSAIEEALQLQKKFYGHGADTHFALDNWAKKYKDGITQEKQG